ncbi:hypothetical protein ACIQLJ_08175 [Microbacterium sp. NPDC091313]
MSERLTMPPAPSRPPELHDDFADGLSEERWMAHYLPQWTTPERSAARVGLTAGALELRIEDDQPDWRPEDAPLRVSNLQTGAFSGPPGSSRGTHRHRDNIVVRTRMQQRLLFAPSSGRIDVTVSASTDEGCMTAVWLVGTEHLSADDCGEICVFEIDSDAISSTGTTAATTARSGIRAHGDSRLADDMADVVVPVDGSRPHTWSVVWGAGVTLIGCEGVVVRRLEQAPDYPLFLMIDLFEVAPPGGSYPKTALLHEVSGWAGA